MSAKHLPPAAGLMGVRVNVTAKDIAEGWSGNCYSCPVASAINRHLARGFFAKVGSRDVSFDSRVDGSRPVKPVAFNIPFPEVALKLRPVKS